MDDNSIQTSQQKAGEHHLAEGKDGGAVTVDSRVDEPTPGNPNDLKTSQQAAGEMSVPES